MLLGPSIIVSHVCPKANDGIITQDMFIVTVLTSVELTTNTNKL